jgi:exosortase A-associated hydrolase 2
MDDSSFRIAPQFLTHPGGRRFVLLLEPEHGAARGSVLFVPPFAEEMHKSRRTVAQQSRRLAAAGFRVASLDLAGCGDSEGALGEVSWEDWCQDVSAAMDWLADLQGSQPLLWGLRLGGLLACDVAVRRQHDAGLLLWQPVLNGEQHIDQFLRIELAGQALRGEKGFDRAALWSELRAGRPLHVAGYELSATLSQQIARVRLGDMRPAGNVLWMEISNQPGEPTRPVAMLLEQWRGAGVEVNYRGCRGELFWRTVDSPDSPGLIDATAEALAH